MIDFKFAFDTQQVLDDHINERTGLSGYDVMQERILALLVEIGELANETRCFKFWSSKPPSEKQTILMELVDIKHFLLSIGNYSGYAFDRQNRKIKIKNDLKGTLTELLTEFFLKVSKFRSTPTPAFYIELWDYFMSIAAKLGFTEDEVFEGYLLKNQINHERQENGY